MSEVTAMSQSEYDAEYAKEMERLEAGGSPITPEEEVVQEEQQEPDELEALREQLAKNEKALKDTQRWAHKNSTELAALKREREEEQRAQSRPAILDDNPGLEEAIKHVATPVYQQEPDKNAQLIGTLEKALPELDKLLDEEEFKTIFFELRKDSIDAWLDDPLSAIRDINTLQTKYQSDKAVSNAQKDFEAKKKKLGSMSVPGGSGGKGMSTEVDAAQAMREMSDADFARLRNKTLGYAT